MNIVGSALIDAYAAENPAYGAILREWKGIVVAASWKTVEDIHQSWRHIEVNPLANGSTRVAFSREDLRIIVTVSYATQAVFISRICLVQEYSAEEDLQPEDLL